MRTILFILLITACIQSCGKKKTNSDLRKDIEEIEIETIIKEYETDSTGNILDTVSIQRIKKNENEKIIFKESKLFRGSEILKRTNYYRSNGDLFYSSFGSSKNGVLLIFEAWEEDGRPQKAISVEYDNNKPNDALNIEYRHFFNKDDRIIKTIVQSKYDDGYESQTILKYDELENIVMEVSLQGSDTLSSKKYEYSNKINTRKTIVDHQQKNITKIFYDLSGNIDREEILVQARDSLKMISETKFFKDEKGKLINSETVNLLTDKKTYYKYENN